MTTFKSLRARVAELEQQNAGQAADIRRLRDHVGILEHDAKYRWPSRTPDRPDLTTAQSTTISDSLVDVPVHTLRVAASWSTTRDLATGQLHMIGQTTGGRDERRYAYFTEDPGRLAYPQAMYALASLHERVIRDIDREVNEHRSRATGQWDPALGMAQEGPAPDWDYFHNRPQWAVTR